MSGERILAALEPVVELFGSLQIPYQIGGSVAASTFGEARSTLDVDMVADVALHHVEPIVTALRDRYYVAAELIQAAVETRSCFNLIFLPQYFKVDIFVPKDSPYARMAFGRFTLAKLVGSGSAREFRFATPEDVVLHKLDWFKQGGEASERQWTDILGILRVLGTRLDWEYARSWAVRIGVDELLERASAFLENEH